MIYNDQNGRETVYHAGNGFYSPYIEPEWKKERRLIAQNANGIGFALLIYLAIGSVFRIIYQLADPLAVAFFSKFNISLLETYDWMVTLVSYVVSIAVPFGIYLLATRMPMKVAFPFKKAKWDLGIGTVLVGLGMSVLASYSASALQGVFGIFGLGINAPEYVIPETVLGYIVYAVTLSVAPAFVEEIVFRGIVMQSLRRFGDVFALIASSLAFAVFHLNLMQMPYAFIMGLCLGYFAMRSGSIWPVIIMHFVNNIIALAFEVLFVYLSEELLVFVSLGYNLVCVILAVIGIVMLLARHKDMFRFEKAPGVLSAGKKTEFFITAPIFVVAMIFAVSRTLGFIYLL